MELKSISKSTILSLLLLTSTLVVSTDACPSWLPKWFRSWFSSCHEQTPPPPQQPKVPPKPLDFSTFKVCENITVEKFDLVNFTQNDHHNAFKTTGDLHFATNISANSVISKNGFMNSIIEAYQGHHNLIIRPDDVWASIMLQLSFFVDKHSGIFSSTFGDSNEIHLSKSIYTMSRETFRNEMTSQIRKNLGGIKRSWILPNFSTTTSDDIISIGAFFMSNQDKLNKYFEYKPSVICGIPSITLEGHVGDWIELRNRLTNLRTYYLGDWERSLTDLLDHFIQAKKGKIEANFLGKICNNRFEDSMPPTGQGCSKEWMSEWMANFNRFDTSGNLLQINMGSQNWTMSNHFDYLAGGIVEVPLKVIGRGSTHRTKILAGHVAFEVKNGHTLQPTLGWSVNLGDEDENKSDEGDGVEEE